jgi:hypothetical protein
LPGMVQYVDWVNLMSVSKCNTLLPQRKKLNPTINMTFTVFGIGITRLEALYKSTLT